MDKLEEFLQTKHKRLYEIEEQFYIKRIYTEDSILYECTNQTATHIAKDEKAVKQWWLDEQQATENNTKHTNKAYGYIRVSTEQQDYGNQKYGILEYANKHNIQNVEFIEETISSRKKLEERLIWDLVNNTLQENDIIITSELSRFGRSTLEVMHIFKLLTEKKIKAHIIKNNIKLNEEENKITNQVLVFAFGLAAEIERDLISSRTKEALARKKVLGQTLGRKKGQQVKSKLDDKRDLIIDYLKKDINITAIAKLCDCGRTTMEHYIKSRKLKELIAKEKAIAK